MWIVMDLAGISIGRGQRTPFVASYASSFGGARASPKTLATRGPDAVNLHVRFDERNVETEPGLN